MVASRNQRSSQARPLTTSNVDTQILSKALYYKSPSVPALELQGPLFISKNVGGSTSPESIPMSRVALYLEAKPALGPARHLEGNGRLEVTVPLRASPVLRIPSSLIRVSTRDTRR